MSGIPWNSPRRSNVDCYGMRSLWLVMCVGGAVTLGGLGVAGSRGMSRSWRVRFDFDGDGRKDEVVTAFSGGAHCCYTIGVRLARDGRLRRLPFELDGGYVRGLDLSRPEHFNIADYDGDRRPELCMVIQTYNGRPTPIARAWRRRFGVQFNRVLVSFVRGRTDVRDYRCGCEAKPSPACRVRSSAGRAPTDPASSP